MNGRDTRKLISIQRMVLNIWRWPAFLYVSESNVKSLDTGQFIESYAAKKWACEMVYDSARGSRKTMTVELPSGSSFAVYDENGVCVNFTVVSDNNKVKLPKNGTVVFAGAPNSEFTVALN